MSEWMVISNCQTVGLTNCLSLLNPDVNVVGYSIWELEKDDFALTKFMYKYEYIFVTDSLYRDERFDFHLRKNVFVIPVLSFYAYHPDLCYIVVDDKIIKSPMDDYHSIICLAAFQSGCDEKKTFELFSSKTYEAGGYFDLWASEEKRLCDRLLEFGYDIRSVLRRWANQDSFMMSVNHPKIRCLYDLAKIATLKVGKQPVEGDILPHDNLCNAVVYPVYPEIGERLGVRGTYRFKLGGCYRSIDLKQFIAGSFEEYRRHGPEKLETRGSFETRRAAIAAIL